MLKIKKTGKTINPHGGINFIIDELNRVDIPGLVDEILGSRNKPRVSYKYSDAVMGLIYGVFCGAERLRDVSRVKKLLDFPGLNIPSHHRISDMFRDELAADSEKVIAQSGNVHDFNYNPKLNELLIQTSLMLGLLGPREAYTLDYDNTVIPTEKHDAQWTYKKYRGYIPGVSWIGQIPVFVEQQNGSQPPKYKLLETVKRTFDSLDDKGIKINRFRSDSAAYQRSVIEYLDRRDCEFFIRANNSKVMWEHINQVSQWDKVRIGLVEYEVAGFSYQMTNEDKTYRIMVSRIPEDNGKPHSKTGEPFVYRCIITNNWTMSNREVLAFYNQRGAIEKNYDILNNDFMWKNLPFSYLHENTVFMIVTAIAMDLYRYLIALFASRVDWVESTDRMKTFRFSFISMSAEFTYNETGELELLIHDTDRDWEQLAA